MVSMVGTPAMWNKTRQNNTVKPAVTMPNNLYNRFNNGIFEYRVLINNYKYYFMAYISIENNSTVRLTPYISNTSYVPSNIVYLTNTIYYKIQIKSLQFGYPEHINSIIKNNNITFNTNRNVNEKNGLISYINENIINKKHNINMNINLIKHSGNIMNYLKNERLNNRYYFFIPGLISPGYDTGVNNINSIQKSTLNNIRPMRLPINSGVGGTAAMLQKDNPGTQLNVWYASTCLYVSNFNSGSYSMCAKAESPLHNWWLGYKSINASGNKQDTEVSAYGNACFYGIFAGPYSCTWLAYPEINVHAYSNGTTIAYIHNTIYNSPKLYSSGTLFNGDFSGYKCVIQYIVN